jgi:hypothetical protein
MSSSKKNFRRNQTSEFSCTIERLEDRRLMSAALTVSQSLMVFNAVKNNAPSPTETLVLTNTGDAPLSVGGLSVVNDPSQSTQSASRFTLLNTASAPASLAPGASFGLQVDYSPTATGLDYALLDIATSDPNTPLAQVQLHGIGTAGVGGGNQPSLERILQAYDEPNYADVGETNVNSAYYPEPPAANSDEVPLQELVKAGPGPVTINVLASFTASTTKPYTLGWYNVADPQISKQQLFYTPTSESQSVYVQPQGLTSFDPGNTVFGFYNPSATIKVNNTLVTGYSQDALNTWDTTDQRKFRFFPLENANGSIVPNSYIMTSTEYYTPAGYDFTNLVAIVSNVTAAPSAPGGPVLSISNPVALPGSNTLIFSRIQNPNTTLGDTVHDTNTITLENTGQGNLNVSNISVAATTSSNGGTQYQLVNPPTFPFTLGPGQTQTIQIQFVLSQVNANGHSPNETNSVGNGGGGSVYPGILTITSNDANAPTTTIPMAGWWQEHSENENEPDLQTIVNMMVGYGTNINPSQINFLNESTSVSAAPIYYGEEVVSAYWTEADSTQSVGVTQIDAFHTQGDTSGLNYYAQGSTSTHNILSTGSDVGQTFFPLNSAGTAAAAGSFSTTGNFGFEVLNPNEYSDDSKNVGDDASGHEMRFYPVRNSAGVLIPNTYLLCADYPNGSEQNFDFQDNVYLVTNIRPASVNTVSAPQTTGGAAAPAAVSATATASGVSLQWVPVLDSTVTGYNIYSSLSATTGYSLVATTAATAISYFDASALPGETLYYRVAAVNSTGVGLGMQTSVLTSGVPSTNLQSIAINESPAGSTTVVTPNQAYTVVAGGPGVTGTSDGFRYLFAAQTGDFDVAMQVSSITTAGSYSTAGIMARVSLSSTSPNVYMSASPINYRFKYRTTDGGTEAVTAGTTQLNYPNVWVRLSRVGNVFTGYISTDGIIWTLTSQQTLASFPTTVYLGVAVAANTTAATATAQIANYGNTPVYTGPISKPATYAAVSGETIQASVLANDVDPVGTIDPTTFTITTPPSAGGSVSFNPNTGLLTYTSAIGFVGTETLAYTVADNHGAVSSPATITFNVAKAKPVAAADTFQATAGQVVQLNVLANDTDATSTLNPATVAIAKQPNSHATITVNPSTGVITYLAPVGFSGTDTFTYTVSDYAGEISLPATVTVTVAAANVGKLVTTPFTATAIAGVPTILKVLSGDSDTSATILPATVSITLPPGEGGTAKANADGTITYTPAAGFAGVETFYYSVSDSAGRTSVSTLVSVTVSDPAIAPIATNATTTVAASGSDQVNVATSVISSVGLNLSTITVGTAPTHGTTSINTTTGVITYTPAAGFVGPDTFAYTVADVNGHLSNVATVNVNVGVNIGNAVGDDRTLTFTTGSGAATTISLNRGTVEVLFNNPATLSVDKHGRATVAGSGLEINSLEISGTNAASTLSVASKGKGALNIGGIADSTPIRTLSAPTATLSGSLSFSGVGTLQALQISDAQITVGAGIPSGFTLLSGTVSNSTLSCALPIKLIKSTSWTSSTSGASSVSAPSVASLVTTGGFAANLTTTGGSNSLNSVHIGGQAGGQLWSVTGNARSIFVGSASSTWGGLAVSGNLASFTVAAGNLTAPVTAGSINSMKVAGAISADITTTGNLLSLQAAQLVNSVVAVGSTANSVTAATASNIGSATLGNLRLTSRAANTFSDSSVIADVIGAVTTGSVNTASGATPEGLAAQSIKGAAVTVSSGILHLNAKTLLSSDALQAFLVKKGASLGTFAIDLV